MPIIKDYVAHFWARVNKTEGCWLWRGTIGNRYGTLKFHKKRWMAHRLAWTLVNGNIPENMNVLHKCDVPLCVNPGHLFLGTHKDNMNDMAVKNRRKGKARGECHGRAKLTEQDILNIRNSSEKHRDLAARYGVGKTTIGHIIHKRNWSYL